MRCTLLIIYLEGKAALLSLVECISLTNDAAGDSHHTLAAWQARGWRTFVVSPCYKPVPLPPWLAH